MRMIDADELKNQVRHMPRTVNPNLVQYNLVQSIIENMPTLTPPYEWVSRMREIEELYAKLRAVTGCSLEQIIEMFAAGYTLEKPDYSNETMDRLDQTTPPNEPLTLEQLREMDGEPVWIVEHPDWGHWELSADAEDYIADRDQDLYGLKHDDPAGQCGLHVLGWLAYRRPPEGEEDT